MWRRSFTILSLLSAIAFAVVLVSSVSGKIAQDDFFLYRWNPASRTLTEATFSNRSDGVAFNARATVALPTDVTTVVQAKAGPSNVWVSHRRWPNHSSETSFLWGDHYHTTSVAGINASGTTECWTLYFRFELPLMLFCVLPAVWGVRRSVRRRRRSHRRGFVVEPSSSATSADH